MEKSLSTMARLGIRQAIGANAGIFLPLILGASYDIPQVCHLIVIKNILKVQGNTNHSGISLCVYVFCALIIMYLQHKTT